jgi:hypothetical protein
MPKITKLLREGSNLIYPVHELPFKTPAGRTLPVRYSSEGLLRKNIIFGCDVWRAVNLGLYIHCHRYINNPANADKLEKIYTLEKEHLRSAVNLHINDFIHFKPNIFGVPLKANLLYECGSVNRRRSGGKDPETNRNKQVMTNSVYRFNTIYDIYYSQQFQMLCWMPWYHATFTGQIDNPSDFTWDMFQQELDIINDIEPEQLTVDYLYDKTTDEKIDEGIIKL